MKKFRTKEEVKYLCEDIDEKIEMLKSDLESDINALEDRRKEIKSEELTHKGD